MNRFAVIIIALFSITFLIRCDKTKKKTMSQNNYKHWAYIGKHLKDEFTPHVKNSYIDLHFNTEGKLGGRAGCNNYTGSFKEKKKEVVFTIGEMASTMTMCSDEIMKQEDEYLSLLQKVTKKEQKGNKLYLYISKNEFLVFNNISDQFKSM